VTARGRTSWFNRRFTTPGPRIATCQSQGSTVRSCPAFDPAPVDGSRRAPGRI
jgi:hypothetical protein